DNINSPDGAKQQLQKALEYLQKCDFDENRWHSLAEEIKTIKEELVAQEKHYRDLRSQRASDEERLSELGESIQRLKQHLDGVVSARTQFERRAAELASYAQLPIDAYRRIQVCFDTAELQLPEGRVPWWIRLWRWLTGTTEKRILAKTALACQSEIQQTLDGPFRVEVPTSRSILIRQGQLVRERLANAQELQSVQGRLGEINEDAASTEQKRSEASWEFTSLERKLTTPLEDFYACFHTRCHEQHKELFKLSREFLCQEALCSKDRVKTTLELYSNFLSGDWKASKKMEGNLDEHLKALSLMFPVITCGLLSVRNMLPWIKECVDRTIVDEAGMIPLHQTFPLLVRSYKAIVVGDPLQIEPIINQNPSTLQQYHQKAFLDKGLTESDIHCYSPDEVNSATTYHRAAGASEEEGTGQGIRLIEHYRCQPSIISFCDRIAGYGLEVKTKPISSRLESNLIAYHVEGNISGKVNQEEVTAVCELIQHLVNQGYSLSEDIGVISAFRHQANELSKCLTRKFPELQKDYIGTIHTFQGSEKRVIILSTMVCSPLDKNKVDWINKRPNLLNVAVSRAKEVFILVGNLYRLEKAEGFTRQLVEHIREHGVILEYKPETKNPYQSSSSYPVFDCDHLGYFSKAIQEVEEELIIVTPWIRGSEPKRFAKDIISALARGVKVKVIYGYRNTRENYDNDDNDALAERSLKELFFQYQDSTLIRLGEETYIDSRGTNEQILICDTKFAVVGSWNWLSHFYRDSCSKKLVNPKVQIRQETSVLLSESSPILSLKERVNQLIQQYRNL
ncbi:MAG: AAA domain-containing protein, partial [Cyanobacteriota bacterium]